MKEVGNEGGFVSFPLSQMSAFSPSAANITKKPLRSTETCQPPGLELLNSIFFHVSQVAAPDTNGILIFAWPC